MCFRWIWKSSLDSCRNGNIFEWVWEDLDGFERLCLDLGGFCWILLDLSADSCGFLNWILFVLERFSGIIKGFGWI